MKKILLLCLLVLASPVLVVADNLIKNGDFSEGKADWYGDGKTAEAFAASNPAAAADPLYSKGLIVPLDANSWSRVYQTFTTGQEREFSIVVTYKLSPDLDLSKDPEFYKSICKKIKVPGFDGYSHFSSSPGVFFGLVGDPSMNLIANEIFTPVQAPGDVQVYKHSYPAVPVSKTKIFALGFPPGKGTVVILSVEVTGK